MRSHGITYPSPDLSPSDDVSVDLASTIADSILLQSLEFAASALSAGASANSAEIRSKFSALEFVSHVLASGDADTRNSLLSLMGTHARVTCHVYASHERTGITLELSEALRCVLPEVAAAISGAGVDLSAGIVEGLQRMGQSGAGVDPSGKTPDV